MSFESDYHLIASVLRNYFITSSILENDTHGNTPKHTQMHTHTHTHTHTHFSVYLTISWMTLEENHTKVNFLFQLRLFLASTNISICSFILVFIQPFLCSKNIFCVSEHLVQKIHYKLQERRSYFYFIISLLPSLPTTVLSTTKNHLFNKWVLSKCKCN
jgi:hypothetical protein